MTQERRLGLGDTCIPPGSTTELATLRAERTRLRAKWEEMGGIIGIPPGSVRRLIAAVCPNFAGDDSVALERLTAAIEDGLVFCGAVEGEMLAVLTGVQA